MNEKCFHIYVLLSPRYSADTYQRVMLNMDAVRFTDLANETFYFIEREAHRVFSIKMFDQQVARVVSFCVTKL